METLGRLLAVTCTISACGTVTSSGDGGEGGSGLDAGPGGGGVDAAAAPSRERLFHVVPEADGAARLYAADLVDDALEPARLLSGQPVNPAAVVSSVRISADGQTLVYQADGETAGEPDLYAVRFDGPDPDPPVRLSDAQDAAYVVESFLAADGSAAIYGSGTSSGGWVFVEQYYFVDLSGPAPGAPVPLGGGDTVYGGTLSEDGSAFAFIEGGNARVVSLRTRPIAAVQVGRAAAGRQGVQSLALTPDGSAIALAGDLVTADVTELFVADLSGAIPGPARRASRPLVANGDVDAGVLAIPTYHFSADGKLLAYLADARTDGVTELFVVDVSGGLPGENARVSADLVAGGDVMVESGSSPFSPDGRLIAYRADQLSDDVFELFVVDVSGGVPAEARRINGPLAAGGDVSSYAFAPDGNGIAYRADQRADDLVELFYADTSGFQPAPAQRVNADPVSGGDVSTSIAFPGDAGEIAFAGDLVADERAEVYRAVIAGGALQSAERVQAASPATSRIHSIAFSAGGSLVFSGDTARTTCDLWIAVRGGATLNEAQRVNVSTAQEGRTIAFWLRPLPITSVRSRLYLP
jgi:Tol biopolymer transport system component